MRDASRKAESVRCRARHTADSWPVADYVHRPAAWLQSVDGSVKIRSIGTHFSPGAANGSAC